jgi:hypothetical protein
MLNSAEMRITLMNSSSSEISNNRHDPDYPAQDLQTIIPSYVPTYTIIN